MAPFVAFSNDFQTLRIGTQLYARRGENSFDAIQGAKATSTKRHPAYVEEFARRDNIVILASRFMLNNRILEPFQDAEKIADTEDSEDESDSDPEDDYESWSETSSIHSGSDEEQDWHSSSDSDSDESADAAYSLHEASNSESDEVYDEDEDVDGAPSDLESLDVETEAIVGRAEDEEEEYACDLEGDVEGESGDQKVFSHAWRTKFRKSRFHHTWASITIVDTTGTNPKELFNFSRPITFKMYDSPPVIHPFHPLAVWPVGCGDVLFVDFERESHFVRRLRPSTYGSKQLVLIHITFRFVTSLSSTSSIHEMPLLFVRQVSPYCHARGEAGIFLGLPSRRPDSNQIGHSGPYVLSVFSEAFPSTTTANPPGTGTCWYNI